MSHHGQIPKTKLKEYRHNQTLAENGQLWAFSLILGAHVPSSSSSGSNYTSAVLQPAEWQNKPDRNLKDTLYFLDLVHLSPNFEIICLCWRSEFSPGQDVFSNALGEGLCSKSQQRSAVAHVKQSLSTSRSSRDSLRYQSFRGPTLGSGVTL